MERSQTCSEGNLTPRQLVYFRSDQLPGPPTYPHDEDICDGEDDIPEVPQVDIRSLNCPLSPRQREIFVANVPPVSLQDVDVDYYWYSIENALRWLDYTMSLPI